MSIFDAAPLNQAEGDSRYIDIVSGQSLTSDQQTQARTNLGIVNADASIDVNAGTDGTVALFIGSSSYQVGFDGGIEY